MLAATNNVVARTSTDLTACGTFQNVWREIAANLIVHVRAPVTLHTLEMYKCSPVAGKHCVSVPTALINLYTSSTSDLPSTVLGRYVPPTHASVLEHEAKRKPQYEALQVLGLLCAGHEVQLGF